jgi:hypothetical protein
MRSFMTLESLTWGTKPDEGLEGEAPRQGGTACPASAPGSRLMVVGAAGAQGCNDARSLPPPLLS